MVNETLNIELQTEQKQQNTTTENVETPPTSKMEITAEPEKDVEKVQDNPENIKQEKQKDDEPDNKNTAEEIERKKLEEENNTLKKEIAKAKNKPVLDELIALGYFSDGDEIMLNFWNNLLIQYPEETKQLISIIKNKNNTFNDNQNIINENNSKAENYKFSNKLISEFL